MQILMQILQWLQLIIQQMQQNYTYQLLLYRLKMTRLLEQLRAGFKITIKWNKHGSEIINRNQNNIDPTFTKVNRLFVLSFENENYATSFSKYYVSNA